MGNKAAVVLAVMATVVTVLWVVLLLVRGG